jgi:peroxiredoxin
VVPPAALL